MHLLVVRERMGGVEVDLEDLPAVQHLQHHLSKDPMGGWEWKPRVEWQRDTAAMEKGQGC